MLRIFIAAITGAVVGSLATFALQDPLPQAPLPASPTLQVATASPTKSGDELLNCVRRIISYANN